MLFCSLKMIFNHFKRVLKNGPGLLASSTFCSGDAIWDRILFRNTLNNCYILLWKMSSLTCHAPPAFRILLHIIIIPCVIKASYYQSRTWHFWRLPQTMYSLHCCWLLALCTWRKPEYLSHFGKSDNSWAL